MVISPFFQVLADSLFHNGQQHIHGLGCCVVRVGGDVFLYTGERLVELVCRRTGNQFLHGYVVHGTVDDGAGQAFFSHTGGDDVTNDFFNADVLEKIVQRVVSRIEL